MMKQLFIVVLAVGEKSEEDVFHVSSENQLVGEQNCWSSAFTTTAPCARQKRACSPFSSHAWPASHSTSVCGDPNHQVIKITRRDARNMILIQFFPSDSFAVLTHSAACRSPFPAGPCGSLEWRDLVLCRWRIDCDANVAWSVGPGEATRVASTGVRGTR